MESIDSFWGMDSNIKIRNERQEYLLPNGSASGIRHPTQLS
jgi:hypothetical protein